MDGSLAFDNSNVERHNDVSKLYDLEERIACVLMSP